MQRKVNAVGYELRDRLYKLVDIARRDEQALSALVIAQRRGVGNRRNADGDHGAAEVSLAYLGAVVAYAAAGGYSAVAKLHIAAESVYLAAGKGIDRNNAVRAYKLAHAAYRLSAFNACRAQNAGAQDGYGRKGREILRQRGFEVTRDDQAVGDAGTDRVGSDRTVAEAGNKKAFRTHDGGEAPQKLTQCTVFAESEVITLVGEGKPMDEIAAGIEMAVAKRCFVMAKKAGATDSITLTGGCAKNDGLKQAIEHVLKLKVVNLKTDPQLMGALGAAEYARQKGLAKK